MLILYIGRNIRLSALHGAQAKLVFAEFCGSRAQGRHEHRGGERASSGAARGAGAEAAAGRFESSPAPATSGGVVLTCAGCCR